MFKIGQLVSACGIHGIVSAVNGNSVQIMFEHATDCHAVEFRTASAIQWRKFVKVEG
jgi:hypothetical protein